MKTIRQQWQERQSGAVSLFVVIFATLLMIIITISFIQLMLKDQRQATASDLSQSAYDSAQSGVEDAKRLLLLDQACRNNTAPGSVNCGAVATAINSNDCNTVSTIFGNVGDTETLIQQDEGDKALQQSYTCVKITPNTPDYKGIIDVNQSNIVPLKAVDAAGAVTDFDSIVISWFTRADISSTTNAMDIGFPSGGADGKLPLVDEWAVNYPALLRTQFMQTGSSFKLSDLDDTQPGSKSDANTLFLYPAAAGSSSMSFDLDSPRRSASGAPQKTDCVTSFSASDTYACTVTIALPTPIDGNVMNRNAFLRLSALYNGAHYKIQLLKAGTPVLFDHVQPEVDSTGRANDMFRRVKSRVEFKSDFLYPEAAVDIDGDLCKNFIVTDKDPGPGETFGYNSPSCIP